MALAGSAVMVLSFDIEPAAAEEHDEWHTREHLPERLSIPGFLRGSRWRAPLGEPRYMVLYEVTDIGVLSSAAYLERLNDPTAWTRKMMKSYRGMRRGLCRVGASAGAALGAEALLLRFAPAPSRDKALRTWLVDQVLPSAAGLCGIASAHLLHAAASPTMTAEQWIRGRDQGFDWGLLATGYGMQGVLSLTSTFSGEQFVEQGALELPEATTYRLECLLTRSLERST